MWQAQGLYSKYVLRTPLILYGNEAVKELYNYPCSRIAVIHGSSFDDHNLFNMTFRKKIVKYIKRSWKSEPDLNGLKDTLKEIEEFKPDTIIAIGGGSIIDGAKLCRLLYEIPYFDFVSGRIDGNNLKTKFIAIPTTIGSGAEVSSAAVYVEENHKQMVVLHELQPDVIVYDPRYVEKTPNKILCESGLDALSHILEGYASNIENRLVETQAENGLYHLRKELSNVINDRPVDYLMLQYGGYIGGIVQNHCIVGAAHGIAHQLSQFGFSHGEAVALLIGAVIKVNSKVCNDKYQKLIERSGFNNIDELISFANAVCDKSGISKRREELKELLISKENDETFMNNIREDRGGKGNPVELCNDYLKEVFRSI